MPRSEAAPDSPDSASRDDIDRMARTTSWPGNPRIVPRSEHNISRRDIDPNALRVLNRLNRAGYSAHLVGGGVRDLLLGIPPKDFDVATDAEPEQVRAVFRNCRIIGRRFRLAHVVFGRDVIEVATFRAGQGDPAGGSVVVHDDGRILRDNVFGTIEEDAFRRDFTINALYYDIATFSVLDYTGGMDDIAARRLRLIGDPEARYREDPVRMLRAARFAAKLGFRIDHTTAEPIGELGDLLRDISPSRLFEEVLKLFQTGHAVASLKYLRAHDLLRYLFPAADAALKAGRPDYAALLGAVLENTDWRIAEERPVTPAFLYAAFLWPALLERAARYEADGDSPVMAIQRAASRVVEEQQRFTSLPKRFSGPMREIWTLQPKLTNYRGKRARRLLAHPRLRAAWDFLCLRRDAGETELVDCCKWWEQAMASGESDGEPTGAAPSPDGEQGGRRRRRGRGGRGRRRSGSSKTDAS